MLGTTLFEYLVFLRTDAGMIGVVGCEREFGALVLVSLCRQKGEVPVEQQEQE